MDRPSLTFSSRDLSRSAMSIGLLAAIAPPLTAGNTAQSGTGKTGGLDIIL